MGSLFNNRTGYGNTGVGLPESLVNNTTGIQNVAIGDSTMFSNNGDGNTVIGYKAGNSNSTGNYNTLYGYNANVLSSAYINAAAIGANAAVGQNNSMVIGSINGVNGATADTKVGIGTTTPDSFLSVADKFMVGSSGTVDESGNSVSCNQLYVYFSECHHKNGFNPTVPRFQPWGLQYEDADRSIQFLSRWF